MHSLVLLALTMLSVSGVAAQPGTVAERYLLSAINEERASRQIAPVRLDSALTTAARYHAQQMVEHAGISHRFAGEPELSTRGSDAGARFSRITENVAEGTTAVVIHDAWMRSPGHRANILDAAVDAVGIAVVVRDGQLYAVEDFQGTVATLTLEQQEGAVGLLLDQAGLDLVPNRYARQTCGMASGYAGDQQPTFILRYTTSNLSVLPDQIRRRLGLDRDHQASVGACVADKVDAFSMYSIAILLYP